MGILLTRFRRISRGPEGYWLWAIGLGMVFLGVVGMGWRVEAEEGKKPVVIFAAASTTNAMEEIKSAFFEETGIEVQASYAASAPLSKQILHGADADLFTSADTKWADYLAEKGMVAKRRDVLGNRLVVIVPKGAKREVKRVQDLLSDSIEHIAIGEPSSVPAGNYAKIALVKLGLWEKLEGKLVPSLDVRQALTFVETGAADAGMVYATDAAMSSKVEVVAEIPESLTGVIRYPVVLLKHGEGRWEAEQFFAYLNSPGAMKIFRKYGFEVERE